MPTRIEQRVRYVPQDTDGYVRPLTTRDTLDEAAGDLWLMNRHIVWVEERVVYETPWHPVGGHTAQQTSTEGRQ